MQRIHSFEFEDFHWFPDRLRTLMTRYLVAIHKMLGTGEALSDLMEKVLKQTGSIQIIDLCSGGGGPMEDVMGILNDRGMTDLKMTMTDLYPNRSAAERINKTGAAIHYKTDPVNAADVSGELKGLRTMICSMHHMPPNVAKDILKDAMEDKQPICIYEISDNSVSHWIAWITFPINIIMILLITLAVRPMTWQQILFTYFIPILPLLIAWDGTISNMRTYTLSDLDELTKDLKSDSYTWDFGTIAGKGGNKIYLTGIPTKTI